MGAVDVQSPELRGLVRLGDELWLATSSGARRIEGARVERVGPPAPVHGIQRVGDELWILGDETVARITPANETVFRISGLRPSRVVSAGGNRWILTDAGPAGSAFSTQSAGPVLKVGDGRLSKVAPQRGGVVDVVELDGRVWLLTMHEERPAGAEPWPRKRTARSRVASAG